MAGGKLRLPKAGRANAWGSRCADRRKVLEGESCRCPRAQDILREELCRQSARLRAGVTGIMARCAGLATQPGAGLSPLDDSGRGLRVDQSPPDPWYTLLWHLHADRSVHAAADDVLIQLIF